MSLSENQGGLSAADVAAVMNGGNNGFGWGGDGAWWLIILFLFAMNGNSWGNGFGGNQMLPFMMGNQQNNDVQRGFDQQAIMGQLGAINTAVNNGFGNAEISAANRQMAGIQQMFGIQTAVDSRLDSLAMALQNCCCENRAATADLKYTIANESAATRTSIANGIQSIQDKLCQLEMDGIKQNYENRIYGMQNTIDALRSQLNNSNLDAAMNAKTATILADNAAQTVTLEQHLNPTAVPAYIVQNPNCCANNYSACGCMQ